MAGGDIGWGCLGAVVELILDSVLSSLSWRTSMFVIGAIVVVSLVILFFIR